MSIAHDSPERQELPSTKARKAARWAAYLLRYDARAATFRELEHGDYHPAQGARNRMNNRPRRERA